MNHPEGNPQPNPGNRWYDQDPVLYQAIEQLRTAPDKQQAQIALNIIKIVVEHQIERETDVPVEDLNNTLQTPRNAQTMGRHRRWYDLHETLHSAMQLLQDCPDDLQKRIAPSIAVMIENTLYQVE